MTLKDYAIGDIADQLTELGFTMGRRDGLPYCKLGFTNGAHVAVTGLDPSDPPSDRSWMVAACDHKGHIEQTWRCTGRVSLGEAIEAARDLVDPFLADLAVQS